MQIATFGYDIYYIFLINKIYNFVKVLMQQILEQI
jgi:hypothetical protein